MYDTKSKITLKEALNTAEKYLLLNNISSPQLNAELLLCDVCKISRLDLRLKQNEVLADDKKEIFCEYIKQRATNKPLQYIIGYVEFYNIKLKINQNVLIPRPETEQLVDIICNSNDNYSNILDICTGSGCIALALAKKYPHARIDAIDISKEAIKLAVENKNSLSIKNVNFICIDFLEFLKSQIPNKQYDLIVCNPPYITIQEYVQLEPELYFEPRIALTDNIDGLSFYRIISNEIHNFLSHHGKLFFEYGTNQAEQISEMFILKGYKTKIINDFANKNRFILIQK